jgi:acetolactate synthase-1/3 small subunit
MPDTINAASPSPDATHEQCQLLVNILSETAPVQQPSGNVSRDQSSGAATAVLELRVRNHPGTMSHITGLFARRAFNLDAILCVPVGDGAESRMLLLVAGGPRLEQVEKQLAKLHDVLSVRHRPDLGPEFFARVASLTAVASPAPAG